jgi:glycosyltransferase involved in cell wall biosynthesis
MLKYMPIKMVMPCCSLPPGSPVIDKNETQISTDPKVIKLLYIGGIGAHYDLQLAMKIVSQTTNIYLTVCCRKDDWDKVSELYKPHLNSNNILIVHKSGNDIRKLYSEADVFCLFIKPNVYWTFAVPYKLFEALGYNCPIITSKETWVSRFCEENGIGFSVQYDEQCFREMLSGLTNSQIIKCKKRMEVISNQNTWEKRCNFIKKLLKEY